LCGHHGLPFSTSHPHPRTRRADNLTGTTSEIKPSPIAAAARGAFADRLLDWAQAILATTLHIVRKLAGQRGSPSSPPVAVEPTFAWLTAHRQLARDYKRDPAMSETMIRWGGNQHHWSSYRVHDTPIVV
jgi:hypothetical protein